MKVLNEMTVTFESRSVNEAFARTAAAAFFVSIDPTVEELADLKTAVSEAVTNAIVHGYRDSFGKIKMKVRLLEGRIAYIQIKDSGVGIEDVALAMEPLFTTDPDGERSGLGFTMMESFCDKVTVRSRVGKGTTVTLFKQFTEKERA